MGLDPVEVRILPRVIALVLTLPILAFIGGMAALTGDGRLAWFCGGTNPTVFLVQALDDATVTTSPVPPTDDGKDDRPLRLDLRRFDIASGADRTAEVVFSAKPLSGDGHVLCMRLFEARVPRPGADDASSVKALDAAFGAAVLDLGPGSDDRLTCDPPRIRGAALT